MRKIGLLGYGKIGKAIAKGIQEDQLGEVIFIQDVNVSEAVDADVTITKSPEKNRYKQVDLVIECATPAALDDNLEMILEHGDLLLFSVTAFCEPEFEEKALTLAKKYKRHIYIPHGAILGLDGITDGKQAWESITLETIKNPASLGRGDTVKTTLYKGPTRGACKLFPRNVNVHATVALAGLGFDATQSKIISDPDVNTNTHHITLGGQGITIRMDISSFSEGGVSGIYTPLSAFGSVRRLLDQENTLQII